MAGEVLFFFLFPSFLLSGSKLPLLFLSFSFLLFCPNKGSKRGEGRVGGGDEPSLLRQVGAQLARVITRERDDHEGATDPYCAPRWHLHSLSLRNNISHTCTFFSPLTLRCYTPFQSEAADKGEKAPLFSCVLSLCVVENECLFLLD